MLMHFICDEMLASLGRWLRTAGYDTEIITYPMQDSEIFERAQKENRLLITRDRHFLEMHDSQKHVVFLKGNTLEECINELNERLGLNWLLRPFSRCIVCNSSLLESDDPSILDQVPIMVQEKAKEFWYCPRCKKVYWAGTHTQKMLEQLQMWQRKNRPPLASA